MKSKVFKRLVFMVLSFLLTFSTVFANVSDKDEITLQILFTSDIHNKFYPYDYAVNSESNNGSLAQLSTIIKKLRAENKNTILVDVGDTIQGNSSELFIKDDVLPMIKGFNKIGYDFWSYGNHEFNYGVDVLKNAIDKSNAKVLNGNVFDSNQKLVADSAYEIVEFGDIKLGIIGMVTPNIVKWDSENLKGYDVKDPGEETKKIVNEIKDKVDVIVLAAHMGENNEYDVKNSGVVDIANLVPEIDVILAAHEHKLVEERLVNDVLIAENKSAGQTLIQVLISLKKGSDGKYKITNKTTNVFNAADYEPDKEILELLKEQDQIAKESANTIIGKLIGDSLIPENEIDKIAQAQLEDSRLINLINEVQLYYSKADISSTALFNLNATYPKSELKKSDVSLIYPYDNTLYVLEMTGKQLKTYMEWSASYYNTYKPGDLTISFNEKIPSFNYDMFDGIKYEVNVANEVGNRIQNLTKLDGTPIKDTDKFKVAVNNYRATSQLTAPGVIFEENDMPKIVEIDAAGDLGGVRELIVDYISNVKKGEINPSTTKNWRIVGNDWNKDLRQELVNLVKDGHFSIPSTEDGRIKNIRAVTEDDIAPFLTEQTEIKELENYQILKRKYQYLNNAQEFDVVDVDSYYFIKQDDILNFIFKNQNQLNGQVETVLVNNEIYVKVRDIVDMFNLNVNFDKFTKFTILN